MTEYLLRDTDKHNERKFDSREEAKEQAEELRGLGATVEIEEIGDEPEKDNQTEENRSEPSEVEIVEEPTADELVRQAVDMESLPDPLVTVPEWMTTTVDHGDNQSVDLNKRGTQVIANALDYVVDAECEIEAIKTDFDYARYRATVTTPDGDEYTAVGDAHIKESGRNREDLERLAETRAKKRAVKWATGGGLQAFMEDSDE